jgi:hypothetical protein
MEFGLEAGVWFQCREAARFWHVWSRNNFTFSEKKSQPPQMQDHSPKKANSNPFQNERFFDEQSTMRVRILRSPSVQHEIFQVSSRPNNRDIDLRKTNGPANGRPAFKQLFPL